MDKVQEALQREAAAYALKKRRDQLEADELVHRIEFDQTYGLLLDKEAAFREALFKVLRDFQVRLRKLETK